MKRSLAILAALIMGSFSALHGAELALTSPLDYQVIQRSSFDEGTIRIVGQLSEVPPQNAVIEALVIDGKTEAVWQKLQPNIAGQSVNANLSDQMDFVRCCGIKGRAMPINPIHREHCQENSTRTL